MVMLIRTAIVSVVFFLSFYACVARATDPLLPVIQKVQPKVVKMFGAGGIRNIANYGTGILVSADGHILTASSQFLDSSEIIVHLHDGRRVKAVVIATEPNLDAALLKIRIDGKRADEPTDLNLDYFDLKIEAERPVHKSGDWILAFSNQFEIAMRDEPVSVQRGVIAAYTKLTGRRGVFEFAYQGQAYILDAITNNPGAAGGALTDRKGNLIGIIGKELRNTLTETWMNYALPVQAAMDVVDAENKTQRVTLKQFVELGMKGQYKAVTKNIALVEGSAYHGIVFVPNVLERTPPYVEDIDPDSPAAKAGIRRDDLVSFLEGEPTYSIKMFQDAMKRLRPGTKIRLEVRRGESLKTIELELANPPAMGKRP